MSSIAVNSGIIPRLVGEVLSLLLYRGACFLISKYAIDSEASLIISKINMYDLFVPFHQMHICL